MDLLRKGSDWLEKMRDRHATTEVLYLRASSSVTLRATVGKTDFDVDDGNGLMTAEQSRDYLVRLCDLTIDDLPITPKTGDRIIEGDQTNGFIYEVAAPAGQPVWRWSDPYRQTVRIHTKYAGLSGH